MVQVGFKKVFVFIVLVGGLFTWGCGQKSSGPESAPEVRASDDMRSPFFSADFPDSGDQVAGAGTSYVGIASQGLEKEYLL